MTTSEHDKNSRQIQTWKKFTPLSIHIKFWIVDEKWNCQSFDSSQAVSSSTNNDHIVIDQSHSHEYLMIIVFDFILWFISATTCTCSVHTCLLQCTNMYYSNQCGMNDYNEKYCGQCTINENWECEMMRNSSLGVMRNWMDEHRTFE